MADTKISALTASSTPLAGTEVLPIVQSSSTKKVTVANLTEGRTVKAGNLEVAGYGIFSDALNMLGGKTFYLYNPANNNYWGISENSSNDFLVTNGASGLAFSITQTGNATVSQGNLKIGTAAKGIDFSINSNATGMTSELLNDYEEGTWTPVFADALTGGNASGTSMSGVYTKIGNLVTISFGFAALDASGMTGGNTAYFRSLPFATSATNETTASPRLVGATFTGYASALLGNSRSGFYILEVSSGGAFSTLTVSDLASSGGTVTLQYFV